MYYNIDMITINRCLPGLIILLLSILFHSILLNRSSSQTRDHIPRAADGRRCPSSLRRPRSAKALRESVSWFLLSLHLAYTNHSPREWVAGPWLCHSRGIRHSDSTRGLWSVDSNRNDARSLAREETPSLSRLVARCKRLPISPSRVAKWLSRAAGSWRWWEPMAMLYNHTALTDPRECSTRAALQRDSSPLSLSWKIRRRSGRRRVAPRTRCGAARCDAKSTCTPSDA